MFSIFINDIFNQDLISFWYRSPLSTNNHLNSNHFILQGSENQSYDIIIHYITWVISRDCNGVRGTNSLGALLMVYKVC